MIIEYMGCGWGASIPVLIDTLFSAVPLKQHTTRDSIIEYLVYDFCTKNPDLDASRIREAVEKSFPVQILALNPKTNLEAYFLCRY